MHLSCHAWHGDSLVIMNTVFGTCILRWKWSSSQNTNIPSVRNTLNTWTSCYLQGNIPFANSFVWKVYESEAGLNCYFVLFQVISWNLTWFGLLPPRVGQFSPASVSSRPGLLALARLSIMLHLWPPVKLCRPFKSIRLLTHNLAIHFTWKP